MADAENILVSERIDGDRVTTSAESMPPLRPTTALLKPHLRT